MEPRIPTRCRHDLAAPLLDELLHFSHSRSKPDAQRDGDGSITRSYIPKGALLDPNWNVEHDSRFDNPSDNY
jgi:hypothetical protein